MQSVQVNFFIIVYYELVDPVNTELNTLIILFSAALVSNGKKKHFLKTQCAAKVELTILCSGDLSK